MLTHWSGDMCRLVLMGTDHPACRSYPNETAPYMRPNFGCIRFTPASLFEHKKRSSLAPYLAVQHCRACRPMGLKTSLQVMNDKLCSMSCGGRPKAVHANGTNKSAHDTPSGDAVPSERALGPGSTDLEVEFNLPMPMPGAGPESLIGTWQFVREVGSMDKFYMVMGVPWGLRKLLLTVNPDMVWSTDEDGSIEMGSQPGQKGQLVRRSMHKGSQIGAPEAFPLGEFSLVNPVSDKTQGVVTTFSNGRLERRTIDEWLPAGCIYSRWQAGEHQLVEIGCLGQEDNFYFARVYRRLE